MRVFARDWVDCYAAVVLSITTIFLYLHEQYPDAIITSMCAGLVAGMVFTRWAMRR